MLLEDKYLHLISAMIERADNPVVLSRFSKLFDCIVETNDRINITSITDPMNFVLKHIVDSLSLLYDKRFCVAASRSDEMCDIGCGGGFPGLPVACVFPESKIVMIDSTEKKIRALNENAKRLGLENVNGISGRGEALAAAGNAHREKYPIVFSRAVAALPVLCELCLPFVSVNGTFYALKGSRAPEELNASGKAIEMLGARVREVIPIRFDALKVDRILFSQQEIEDLDEFLSAKRYLICIDKVTTTKSIYPRGWAQMAKKPL